MCSGWWEICKDFIVFWLVVFFWYGINGIIFICVWFDDFKLIRIDFVMDCVCGIWVVYFSYEEDFRNDVGLIYIIIYDNFKLFYIFLLNDVWWEYLFFCVKYISCFFCVYN